MPDAATVAPAGPLLRIENVEAWYGPIPALRGVSIEVGRGEVVCLLGGNASGKSTTMKTILGIVRPRSGTVTFAGETLNGLGTQAIVAKGISLVPEARRLFGRMTVWENLMMGAFSRRRGSPGELA